MKLSAVLFQTHARDERFASLRILENEAQSAGRSAEVDAVETERLAFARAEVNAHQGRGPLVILGVHEPATIRAHAGPIFIGLAERDLPRRLQRTFQGDMPEIIIGHAAVSDREHAASLSVVAQTVDS